MKTWKKLATLLAIVLVAISLASATLADESYVITLENDASDADAGVNHEGAEEAMNGFVLECDVESAVMGEDVTVSIHPATFCSGYWNVSLSVVGEGGEEIATAAFGFSDGENAYVIHELDFQMPSEAVTVIATKEETDSDNLISNAEMYLISLDAEQAAVSDPGVDYRGNDVEINGVVAALSTEKAAENQTVDVILNPGHAMGKAFAITVEVTAEDEKAPFYHCVFEYEEGNNTYDVRTASFVMPAAPVNIVVTKAELEGIPDNTENNAIEADSGSDGAIHQITIDNQVNLSEDENDNFDVECEDSGAAGQRITVAVRPTFHVTRNWNVQLSVSTADGVLLEKSYGFVDGNNHYIIHAAEFDMPDQDVFIVVTKEETALENLAPQGNEYPLALDEVSNLLETEAGTNHAGAEVQMNGFNFNTNIENATFGQTVAVTINPKSFISVDFVISIEVVGLDTDTVYLSTVLNYTHGSNAYSKQTIQFPMPDEAISIVAMKNKAD